MSSFASRLLDARSAVGLTQKELADGAGISSVQLSRYETGKSQPRPPVLAQLARVLSVKPEWLANGNPADEGDPPKLGSAVLKIHLPIEMLARLEASALNEKRTLNEEVRWRLGLSLDEAPYTHSFNPTFGVLNRDGTTTPQTMEQVVKRLVALEVRDLEKQRASAENPYADPAKPKAPKKVGSKGST